MWQSRLVVIIVCGQILGVYRDFGDVPLWYGGAKKPRHLDPEHADGAEGEDQQLVQADATASVDEARRSDVKAKDDKGPVMSGAQELVELRKFIKNAIFVAAAVYAKDGVKETTKIIAYIVRPLWNDHPEHARAVLAPTATKRFYSRAAKGQFS